MTKRTTEQCLAEHPESVYVYWSTMYRHTVRLSRDEMAVIVNTASARATDDGDSDDAWWCMKHDDIETPKLDIDYT